MVKGESKANGLSKGWSLLSLIAAVLAAAVGASIRADARQVAASRIDGTTDLATPDAHHLPTDSSDFDADARAGHERHTMSTAVMATTAMTLVVSPVTLGFSNPKNPTKAQQRRAFPGTEDGGRELSRSGSRATVAENGSRDERGTKR